MHLGVKLFTYRKVFVGMIFISLSLFASHGKTTLPNV